MFIEDITSKLVNSLGIEKIHVINPKDDFDENLFTNTLRKYIDKGFKKGTN